MNVTETSMRRAGASSFLLAMWFALIGADRIDLVGGALPFRIPPFLVLTPIVAIAELARRWRQRSEVETTGGIVVYMALAGLLLALGAASSVHALEVNTSAPRTFLLTAHVIGTLVIALLAADRPDLNRVLAAGAAWVLPLFILTDVAVVRCFIGHGPDMSRLGPATIFFDKIQTVGLVPRLPGLVADANRTGLILAVYWTVLFRVERRPWWCRIALAVTALLMVLTFSRSTMLAVAAAMAFEFMTRSRPPTAKMAAVGMLVLTVGIGSLIVVPKLQTAVVGIGASQQVQRLSPKEGSAKSHLALIARGVEEGSSSIPRSLIGLGYGNAYLVLQDFFPGTPYGNFHSLYVTMFAEMGVFAFVATLILLLTPVFLGGPWRPMAAAAVIFNVFYQTTTEPIFWFVLSMAWMTLATRKTRAREGLRSGDEPRALIA